MGVFFMIKFDFKTMSMKELRAYVLSHRHDQEAFYFYVDKLNAEGNWVEMSPSASVDDLMNYPEFLQRFSNEKGVLGKDDIG
ncbi:DUF6887 family protein [Sphaerospermopsis kisseleviana]|nr:hypothetical protein NIES73_34920 [Sphaerospermopsis kisseleviana NIES-73]